MSKHERKTCQATLIKQQHEFMSSILLKNEERERNGMALMGSPSPLMVLIPCDGVKKHKTKCRDVKQLSRHDNLHGMKGFEMSLEKIKKKNKGKSYLT